MVRRAITKTTYREIKGSLGRYVAILAIVALGVGFFAGLKVTKEAMVQTTDQYFRENALFDFRLISSLGLTDEDVEEIKENSFVCQTEGVYSTDILIQTGSGNDRVAKIHSISDTINQVTLLEGRLPQKAGEIVVDSRWMTADVIGKTFQLSELNTSDTKEMFATSELTVVGIVKASYYINFERGSSTLGEGKITGFIYTSKETFQCDYYTEIFVVTDAAKERIYSDEYNDLIDAQTDPLETQLDELAMKRYQSLKDEADTKISEAEQDLADGKAQLELNTQKIEDAEQEIADNEIKIKDGEQELQDNEVKIQDAEKEIDKAKAKLSDAKNSLNDQEAKLNEAIEATKPYQAYPEMYSAYEMQFAQAQLQIQEGRAQIESAQNEIKKNETELADARDELSKGYQEIEDAKVKLQNAKDEIEEAKPKLADAKADIEEGEQKIADAKEDLRKLEEPDCYVLTRNTNIGYACFEGDSSIVEGIGNVFPIFFFLVAALICMTTMNRMVEEQRTQIGIMKALGYSEHTIMGKYTFYAGSAAMVGCIGGFIGGSWAFPYVIWAAYDIMYTVDNIVFVFNMNLAVISLLVSLLCSVGATYLSLRNELQSQAANLIRPKAPASGKRVFLENIGFIWRKLRFTDKVSVRNVFRYKKRFFMMILGVGGCYGLLITGLGIRDSIADVADRQFKDIQTYDMTVVFKDSNPIGERELFEETAIQQGKYIYADSKTVDVEYKNHVKSATMVAIDAKDSETMKDYVHMLNSNRVAIAYPGDGEAVITQKMADSLNINVGDTIILRDPDLKETKVTITGIFINYVYNYVYVNSVTSEKMFGEKPTYNVAFVKSDNDVYEKSVAIGNIDEVSSVNVIAEMRSRVDTMMKSLDYVVLFVIACAAALAFIVMYNLTNINITERMREIATLKVLGFYSRETAVYVFKENFILTLIGCLIGVFMGFGLHRYVMSNINVEVVTFDVKILPISYLIAVALTIIFALIVDFILYFKLERIHMAESLKSIE